MAHIKRRAPEKHTPNDNNTIPNTLVMTSVAVKRDLRTCKQTNTNEKRPVQKNENENIPQTKTTQCQ